MEGIITKPCDKGGDVVVWRKDLYISEAERQLSESTAYTEVHHDPTEENQVEIFNTVKKLIQDRQLPTTACKLIHPCPKTFTFYQKFIKKTAQEDQLCQRASVVMFIYISFRHYTDTVGSRITMSCKRYTTISTNYYLQLIQITILFCLPCMLPV